MDEEIAMLQDCLLNVSQRSQMCKSAQRTEQTPVQKPHNARDGVQLSQNSQTRNKIDFLNEEF